MWWKRSFRSNEAGWTLIELMLTVALIGIITPAITFLFIKMTQGMAADEMRNQMVTLNESTLLRIHERLLSSRHMCQNDTSGTAYQAAVVAGMTSLTTTNYPILTGSLLPLSQPTTTFSPLGATKADFGNSLLFGAYDTSESLYSTWGGTPKVNYIAPVTVTGATIKDSNNNLYTMVIDVYRFYYYYLAAPIQAVNRPVTCYKLIEWQSIQYADYTELTGITDTTLQTNVRNFLLAPANFPSNVAISNAWDPNQATPSTAFYTITGTAINLVGGATPIITEAQCKPVTRISSGILSNGFTYGVCPNSSSVKSCPVTVPGFCTAPASSAIKFPGGFETGISGSSQGMELLVRSVLFAKGASPLPIVNDSTIISNIRDVW
jgi:type II secretory pathway pseudopilin PulG